MTANPHRGEVAVVLGGVAYPARPTYSAILAWEEATCRTTTEILMRFAAGVFTLRELTAVIHAALVAGGANLASDAVGEMIVDAGQTEMLPPAGKLLRNALTGGREPSAGEAPAPEPDEPPSGALQ
jgi:hypothetical protein